MTTDFQKREPTKNEKMLYELFLQQQQMEKGLWSTSTLVIASAILNKVEPEKLAELMVKGDEKLKEYSKKVNDEIKKLEGDKHKDHDHSHEHDHSDLNHID